MAEKRLGRRARTAAKSSPISQGFKRLLPERMGTALGWRMVACRSFFSPCDACEVWQIEPPDLCKHCSCVGRAAELGDGLWLLRPRAERDRSCAELRETQAEGRLSRCSQERSLGSTCFIVRQSPACIQQKHCRKRLQ